MMKLIAGFCAVAGMLVLMASTTFASDHDDGESDLKGRALNLTDLYVFQENWQNTDGSADHLIFTMNTNPRSIARQQYYFSTKARYEFHVSRVADKTVRPTGSDDVVLRFTFDTPTTAGVQTLTMEVLVDGTSVGTGTGTTTNLANSTTNTDASLTSNAITIGGQAYTVFAGLREDPFFFDVECYFRVRGYLATGSTSIDGSKNRKCFALDSDASALNAEDFTAGTNINAIVVKVPKAALQSAAAEKVFDVWETVSIEQ